MGAPIKTYGDFWPFYLGQHTRRANRNLHYFGSGLALAVVVWSVATQNWWWLLAASVAGYGPAWTGHYLIERNRPATFSYPFWSLYSDFRMFFTWLAGRLEGELARHQIRA